MPNTHVECCTQASVRFAAQDTGVLTFFRVCRSQGLAPQRGIWINVGGAVAGCMRTRHTLNAGGRTHAFSGTSDVC